MVDYLTNRKSQTPLSAHDSGNGDDENDEIRDEFREPYEIIIEKNFRAKAKRQAEEAKDELSKVLKRVENTLVEYDNSIKWKLERKTSNLDLLNEQREYESLITDQVAKYKYKQQITIFIVSHTKAIEQKNKLLEQLNDFFNEQQQSLQEAEVTEFDFDLETVAQDVDDCLKNAKNLASQLNDINEEIIQYLIQNTANKQTKGKKKLEKSLKDAKDELASLTDKLKIAQTDVATKESKILDLMRELELKTSEVNRYKTAADSSRKIKDDKGLTDELAKKDVEIEQLKDKIKNMEREMINLTKKLREKPDKSESNSVVSESQSQALAPKLLIIKRQSDDSGSGKTKLNSYETITTDYIKDNKSSTDFGDNDENSDTKNGVIVKIEDVDVTSHQQQQHQISNINSNGTIFEVKSEDVEFLKFKHEKEIDELKHYYEQQLIEARTTAALATTKPSDEPVPSTSEEKDGKKAKTVKPKTKLTKPKSNQSDKLLQKGNLADALKNLEEADEDETNMNSEELRAKMLNEMMDQAETFVQELDLTTDEWNNVSPLELQRRYDIIRRYAINKIRTLKIDYEKLEEHSKEKLNFLKTQFLEHKRMWETERSGLMEQAEVAFKLQVEAQNVAEQALQQLETLLKEEEKLDNENAEKQFDILRERSRTLTNLKSELGENEGFLKDQSFSNIINNNNELTEKIIVNSESLLLKFQNKQGLDKLTDILSKTFEDKFTLVYQNSRNSRSNTQFSNIVTNNNNNKSPAQTKAPTPVRTTPKTLASPSTLQQTKSKTPSPVNIIQQKSLLKKVSQATSPIVQLQSLVASTGNKSKQSSFIESGKEKSNLENAISKVLNEDEVVLNELRNSMKSRSSLRAKHLAQLEEKKANLEELKVKVAHQFLPSASFERELTIERSIDIEGHVQLPNTLVNQKTSDNDSTVVMPSQPETMVNSKEEERKNLNSQPTNITHTPFVTPISPINRMKSGDILLQRTASSKSNRSNTTILSHPIVIEYVKVYDMIVNFKSFLTNALFVSKRHTLTAHGNVLNDIKTVQFNTDASVTPQVIQMTTNVDEILGTVQTTIRKIVSEYLANSHDLQEHIAIEKKLKEQFKQNEGELEVQRLQLKKELSSLRKNQNTGSFSKELEKNGDTFKDIKEKYDELGMSYQQMSAEIEKYQAQIKDDEIKISEMEQTIDILKRQLESAQRLPTAEKSETVLPSAVMFTRLDAERNAKRLKRAISKGIVTEQEYQDAFDLMDEYVSIPMKRFTHIVKKYMHYRKMKEIKEHLANRNNSIEDENLNENTAHLLGKMDTLEEQRANKFAESMQSLHEQRMKLAMNLMLTLDALEKQSGIFLIKPMYSYRGRNTVEELLKQNQLERDRKLQTQQRRKRITQKIDYIELQKQQIQQQLENQQQQLQQQQQFQQQNKFYYKSKTEFVYAAKATNQNWNFQDSINYDTDKLPIIKSSASTNVSINLTTPRILELDVNRMMISQNQIATSITGSDTGSGGAGGKDRLFHNSSNLRSYVTINRPSGLIRKDIIYQTSGVNTIIGPKYPTTPNTTNIEIANLKRSNTTPLPPISPVEPVQQQQQNTNNQIDDKTTTSIISDTTLHTAVTTMTVNNNNNNQNIKTTDNNNDTSSLLAVNLSRTNTKTDLIKQE